MSEKEPSEIQNAAPLPWYWWLIWCSALGLASVLPIEHYRLRWREIVELHRHPWGLVPAHLLPFREFGAIASVLLVAVVLAGIVAWRDPRKGRLAIALSLALTLLGTVAYARYCSLWIVGALRTKGMEQPASFR